MVVVMRDTADSRLMGSDVIPERYLRGLPDEVVEWLGNHESELALAAAAERGEHDADIRETLREIESEQRATQ